VIAEATSPRPRRRRGLLDVTLAALLLYGVYAKTPCGALPVYAVRKYQGKPTPNLLATFSGRETAVELSAPDVQSGVLASLSFPAPIEDAAERTGADPELLVSYLAAHDETCPADGCLITSPPRLPQVLETWEAKEKATLLEVAQGLNKAAKRFGGNDELGLEALYVGTTLVERAVEQARASGLEAAEDVEVHAQFYSAGTRRGPLQNALKVLALHRLRTLAWPADSKWRISSPYGMRTHPVLGTERLHNGTDIATPTGTPLFSAHDGVINRRGRDSVSGNWIKVSYGFDIESTYCHMSSVSVTQNQRVGRKDTVGEAGATGRVTGPHLHYILRIGGETVDPEMYGEAPRRKVAKDGEAKLPDVEEMDEAPDDEGKKKPDAKPKTKTKKAAATKPKAPKPDATKPDATKADAGPTKTDVTTTEADATEADATKADATEAAPTEAPATEAAATEPTGSGAAAPAPRDSGPP
jgi:murein DD-endopeptidase MepM/ murein hydrolase activator NlpD